LLGGGDPFFAFSLFLGLSSTLLGLLKTVSGATWAPIELAASFSLGQKWNRAKNGAKLAAHTSKEGPKTTVGEQAGRRASHLQPDALPETVLGREGEAKSGKLGIRLTCLPNRPLAWEYSDRFGEPFGVCLVGWLAARVPLG